MTDRTGKDSDCKKEERLNNRAEMDFRTFVENHPGIIFTLDKNGIFTLSEGKGLERLGLRSNEYVGLSVFKIYKNFPEIISSIRRALSGEEHTSVVKVDKLFFETWYCPAFDDQGNITGVYGIALDITNQKNVESELLKAKEEAEKSNRLKTEFLAQMSHEIRTPINTILGFASLIESNIGDNLDEDLRDGFSIMNSASKRVIRTIDLILNMSEIQTGTYEYNPQNINLFDDILVKLGKEFIPIAKLKGIELVLTKKTDSTQIVADQYSITQMFANLIDNAIKYTKTGSITISIFRDNDNNLVAEVSDTGVGIAEEYIPRLFEPFSQETQGYTRNYEGNGLGLALVKEYCNMSNANIELESMKGVGSTFRITFNLP
ncbi:ATP-binding protein [Bacteroidota bacterium]